MPTLNTPDAMRLGYELVGAAHPATVTTWRVDWQRNDGSDHAPEWRGTSCFYFDGVTAHRACELAAMRAGAFCIPGRIAAVREA